MASIDSTAATHSTTELSSLKPSCNSLNDGNVSLDRSTAASTEEAAEHDILRSTGPKQDTHVEANSRHSLVLEPTDSATNTSMSPSRFMIDDPSQPSNDRQGHQNGTFDPEHALTAADNLHSCQDKGTCGTSNPGLWNDGFSLSNPHWRETQRAKHIGTTASIEPPPTVDEFSSLSALDDQNQEESDEQETLRASNGSCYDAVSQYSAMDVVREVPAPDAHHVGRVHADFRPDLVLKLEAFCATNTTARDPLEHWGNDDLVDHEDAGMERPRSHHGTVR
ncbi:hypothetical protein IAT40_004506 [Kwoniella sp. CBS 6097]